MHDFIKPLSMQQYCLVWIRYFAVTIVPMGRSIGTDRVMVTGTGDIFIVTQLIYWVTN